MSAVEDRQTIESVELSLWIDNDRLTYERSLVPSYAQLAKFWDRGSFDRDLALRVTRRIVEFGAKRYREEFASMDEAWHDLFPKADREIVAEDLADEFIDRIRLGDRFWE